MRILMTISASPYGDERVFNCLRLAMALQADSAAPEVTICLLGDAVAAAVPN